MFKGKLEVSQRAFTGSDLFSRRDSDSVELVWENGKIMMQGKARKSSNSNKFQTISRKPQHSSNANSSKTSKFSTMDSVMADFPMLVPSLEMGLDQDVHAVPCLSRPIEEPLHNDYIFDYFHDLSRLPMNHLPTKNHLSNCETKSGFLGDNKQCTMARTNEISDARPINPVKKLFSHNQPLLREDVSRNYGSLNQPCDPPMSKMGARGERHMEPVFASSSVCSENSVERTSSEPTRNLKRKSYETEESSSPSEEVEEESMCVKKRAFDRHGSKRSRASKVYNLSERRRRDRINKKMRALQNLIPNCNKEDKTSILDEAIEYLKTLQLQIQILSMGAGMYMQPMMLLPGMQSIHRAHMPHFTPMGLGMGLGMARMGLGMNLLNMNHAAMMVPFQGLRYPVPFLGLPGSTLQAFPHSHGKDVMHR